ncbi:MAG: glycoside hydrolase family 36 protein [bacterium]
MNKTIEFEILRSAPCGVVLTGGKCAEKVELIRQWKGEFCKSKLINRGATPARINRVVLFQIAHNLPGATCLYGEGFQMLSQTGGTLEKPADIGTHTDRDHIRLPAPANITVVYGLLTLSPPNADHILMAFTSCRRFSGAFHILKGSIEVVIDTEDLVLEPGECWQLEEFMFKAGTDKNALLTELADRIAVYHPPLRSEAVPTGWCSWYCFGPEVTSEQVIDNCDFISSQLPALKYVQIDDGYQPAMGDWLETGPAFGGGVQTVLKHIREHGCEPAIWVAPFIAEESSCVFQNHPDWFFKDSNGKPLRSDLVTYGGWRRGPWYSLDGSHPEVQKHLESTFRTMREIWGCTYFKLDAQVWGALHCGKFFDPKSTRVQAYRQGMEAILRGTGDSFILGCNHPLWPSFGLYHGARTSNDIYRDWYWVSHVAKETFHRNWQNGQFWWNDPDCFLLTGDLPDNEFQFHLTATYASGGMLLSGDDLTKLTPKQLGTLRKLIPPTGISAQFTDDTFRIGFIPLPDKLMICLFNWSEEPQSLSVCLPYPCRITDFWTDEWTGYHEEECKVENMPPHSAMLLTCVRD